MNEIFHTIKLGLVSLIWIITGTILLSLIIFNICVPITMFPFGTSSYHMFYLISWFVGHIISIASFYYLKNNHQTSVETILLYFNVVSMGVGLVILIIAVSFFDTTTTEITTGYIVSWFLLLAYYIGLIRKYG